VNPQASDPRRARRGPGAYLGDAAFVELVDVEQPSAGHGHRVIVNDRRQHVSGVDSAFARVVAQLGHHGQTQAGTAETTRRHPLVSTSLRGVDRHRALAEVDDAGLGRRTRRMMGTSASESLRRRALPRHDTQGTTLSSVELVSQWAWNRLPSRRCCP
jgi:hypothetical protein